MPAHQRDDKGRRVGCPQVDLEAARRGTGAERGDGGGRQQHRRRYPATVPIQTGTPISDRLERARLTRRGPGYRAGGSPRPRRPAKDGAPVLYTLLVVIAAIVLAVIVLNLIRSGGRAI